MEGYNDGEADDSHIYAEAEVGEECWEGGGQLGVAHRPGAETYFVHLRSGLGHRCPRFRRAGGRTAGAYRRRIR